ncbi:MAG: cyclase family protein [Chloroflexota bacterium]
MAIIDISGPIREGMWYYGEPYLDMPVGPVRVHEVEFPPKYAGRIFTQVVEMCVQSGAYLETAAHAIKGRENIDQVPLERSWMVPTVVIHAPKGPLEKVTLAEAQADLAAQGVTIEKGDAVLLHTGWDSAYDDPERYLTQMPYIAGDLMHWIMDHEPGIIGCDTPRADSPTDPQDFFGRFFSTDILLLGCVTNLGAVPRGGPKPRLCALPLPIEGACASPVRVVLVTP